MLRSTTANSMLANAACRIATLPQLYTRLVSGLGTSLPSPKHLDDILKLDSLTDKSADDIAALWMQYHSDDTRSRAGTVISAAEYELLQSRAPTAPLFVLPLGKGPGSSLSMLLQWQLPHALFTPLNEFKALGSSAPPHLTVTHYTELQDSKGIVLVRGDVISPHIVSVPEARTLMALAHAFYVDAVNYIHVHNFNHDPAQFDYNAILRQLGHDLPLPS